MVDFAQPAPRDSVDDSTVLTISLSDDVSPPEREKLVANLLDTVDGLNRSAGGGHLEIGEIKSVSSPGFITEQITLHGDLRHPVLKMPKLLPDSNW